MEKNSSLFNELPNEILLEIMDNLGRYQLLNLVRVSQRIRPLAQYLLEHRKKIRLCGNTMQVLVLSPPSMCDEVNEVSRTFLFSTQLKTKILGSHLLSYNITYEAPVKKTRTWRRVDGNTCKQTKIVARGPRTSSKIILMESPNEVRYRRKLFVDAVTADLCLLIVDPQEIDEYAEYIKDTIFGCCFMMSARNVIVAIDLHKYPLLNQQALSATFNEARTKMGKLLNRTVGLCYKIVPIDILTGNNIVPGVSVPTFKWWSGPSLNELLLADQLRTNFDESEFKKLCDAPVRFQMIFKHKIRGIGTVLEGRVMSGVIKPDSTVVIHPKKLATQVRSIESYHEIKEDAKPGDIVGLNVIGISPFNLDNRYTYMVNFKETPAVNCTMAFRAQIAVMKSDRFTQHQIYNVFYGAARIPCLLWWIFPTDGKNHDRAERKLKMDITLPSKPETNVPRTSEYFKQLKEHEAQVKKGKEVHAKLQAESGVNYVRPPKQIFKKATAIFLPLIHYDIETYKPSAFEKNYRGKVMMMEKTSIVGVGRVDRVISVTAPTFNLDIYKDDLNQFATVVDQASSLFNLTTEQKQLELFLDHVTTNEHAKKSIQRFKGRKN